MATSSGLRWRVTEIATCPVCLEDFKEPKSLPCVHTFCLRCLEQHCKEKLPGGEMPCPLCRKEFAIPSKGLGELPHNFFIQCLIDAKEATSENVGDVVCEVCSSDDGDGEKATVYCVDCSQKLCERCSLPHKKMRGGPHQIQQIGTELSQQLVQSRGSYCEKHKDETVKLYCFDCKMNICLVCFATEHQHHRCQEIIDVAEELLNQINSDMYALLKQIRDTREKSEQMEKEKVKFLDEVQDLQLVVQSRGETIKQVVDRQVNELIEELHSMKSVSMKIIDVRGESISLALLAMESFNSYCEELKAKGRPSDITRTADDLHARAGELLQTSKVPEDFYVEPISFVPKSIDEFIDSGQSFVGRLVTKSVTDIKLQGHLQTVAEIDLDKQMKLVKENEDKPKLRDPLYIEQEQLSRSLDSEQTEQKELERTKRECDELTKKLEQSWQNENELQVSLKVAEENIKRLEDEAVNAKQLGEIALQDALMIKDRRENELCAEINETKRQLNKLQKEINAKDAHVRNAVDREKDLLGKLDRSFQDKGELQMQLQRLTSMKDALERESRLNGEQLLLRTTTSVYCPYLSCRPQLLKQLDTKSYGVDGVTQLDDKIFAICCEPGTIKVFGLNNEQLEDIKVKGLEEPVDIVACSETRILYVADLQSRGWSGACVWRVSTDGRVMNKFLPTTTTSSSFRPKSLSLTSGRLLVTTSDAKLLLYRADGAELKRLSFTDMYNLQHAAETSRFTFVFCHLNPQPQVVEVDGDGRIISVYNNEEQLASPRYLSFNSEGKMLIADRQNHHILLLTSDLQLDRVLLDAQHNKLVRGPWRLFYVRHTRRLIVCSKSSPVIQVFAVD